MVGVAWKDHLDDIRLDSLLSMFGKDKPIIGMVHLWPLPGAPGYSDYGMDTILDQARRDTEALLEGGVDGLFVENMWDLPYYVGTDPQLEAVTAQAVAARSVAEMADVPVGVNVIHNGWQAELAIAVAAGLDFLRICILTGARLWDTGDLDGGCAADGRARIRPGGAAQEAHRRRAGQTLSACRLVEATVDHGDGGLRGAGHALSRGADGIARGTTARVGSHRLHGAITIDDSSSGEWKHLHIFQFRDCKFRRKCARKRHR